MDKLLSFQEKKLLIFSLLCKGVQGKRPKIIINPRFYFTDTQKQLWNCSNIYESAVSITSPLKTITDPLKEIKMVKTDLKKVPSQIFFLLVPLGTIAQLFTKKKFPLHNPFKGNYHVLIPVSFNYLKWSPSFFKTITNILDGQLLTNKIEIIKLFGVLGGRKDGFLFAKWNIWRLGTKRKASLGKTAAPEVSTIIVWI